MHVRLVSCIGLEVRVDGTEEVLGTLDSILIHPDTGKVEGFFVALPHFLHTEIQFLSSVDILRFGTSVHVRDFEAVAPLEDRIRLAPLLEDERRFLGQPILSESGLRLGRCDDVQFDTNTMQCEWLFPRRWWRWLTSIPLSDVLEVRQDAIIVRDRTVPAAGQKTKSRLDVFDALPDATEARVVERANLRKGPRL